MIAIKQKNVVIFDLDGTLANIDYRRKLATKPNGKLDWDIFFKPGNIQLDKPNPPDCKSGVGRHWWFESITYHNGVLTEWECRGLQNHCS